MAKLYDADPVREGPRLNRETTARTVRLVGADGEMTGIDGHDYGEKTRAAIHFLEKGDKVKLTKRFRGRGMAHQDLGMNVLFRMRDQRQDDAKADQIWRVEGRMMVMAIAPR